MALALCGSASSDGARLLARAALLECRDDATVSRRVRPLARHLGETHRVDLGWRNRTSRQSLAGASTSDAGWLASLHAGVESDREALAVGQRRHRQSDALNA